LRDHLAFENKVKLHEQPAGTVLMSVFCYAAFPEKASPFRAYPQYQDG